MLETQKKTSKPDGSTGADVNKKRRDSITNWYLREDETYTIVKPKKKKFISEYKKSDKSQLKAKTTQMKKKKNQKKLKRKVKTQDFEFPSLDSFQITETAITPIKSPKKEYDILQISDSKSKLFQDTDLKVRQKLGSQKILNDLSADQFLGNLPSKKLTRIKNKSHHLSSINVYKVKTDKLNNMERNALRKSFKIKRGRILQKSIANTKKQKLELVPTADKKEENYEYTNPEMHPFYIEQNNETYRFSIKPKLRPFIERERNSVTSEHSKKSLLDLFSRDSETLGKKFLTYTEKLHQFEKRREHLKKIREYLENDMRNKKELNQVDSDPSMYMFEVNLESDPEEERKKYKRLQSVDYPVYKKETDTKTEMMTDDKKITPREQTSICEVYSDDELEVERKQLKKRLWSQRTSHDSEHRRTTKMLETQKKTSKPDGSTGKYEFGKELYEKLKTFGKSEESSINHRVSKLDAQKLSEYYQKFLKLKQQLEYAESDTSLRKFKYAGSTYNKFSKSRPNRPPPVIEIQTTKRGILEEIKIVRKKISCPANVKSDVESDVDESQICMACSMDNYCKRRSQ